jgi:hypothetical protein
MSRPGHNEVPLTVGLKGTNPIREVGEREQVATSQSMDRNTIDLVAVTVGVGTEVGRIPNRATGAPVLGE